MLQLNNSFELERTIEQLVERIPGWSSKPFCLQPIPGGITNRNYKLVIDNRPYFLSIAGNNLDALGVDFANKCYNNRVCANLGLSPEVIYVSESDGVLVAEFLPHPQLPKESMPRPDTRGPLLNLLKKLHSGPNFRNEFDMFKLITWYLQIVEENTIVLPPDHQDILDNTYIIGRALSAYRINLVPCHNDVTAENMFSDGKQIFLVDFDYSGQNDPCFELGNLCVEAGFDNSQTRDLVDGYFGKMSDHHFSRTCLQGVLSDVGWALWAFIQSGISSIDFDFRLYGLNRWMKAGKKIKGGETKRWLHSL